MAVDSRSSWHPDRSWADPLILLLTLLALLAAGLTLQTHRRGASRPGETASLQGRIAEVVLAGPGLFPGHPSQAKDWAKAEEQLKEPWDRALLAVLKAELDKNADLQWFDSAAPATPAGERFKRVCLAAYAGGSMPARADRQEVRRRLGNGYAADLLEARLQDREGGGQTLRDQARQRLMVRLAGLGLLGLLVLVMAGGGLAVGIYLAVTRKTSPPPALPVWSMSGRAAALVFLAWFLAFFVAGNLAGLLLLPWPTQRWLALPLGYLLHAAFGVRLICWAEGIDGTALWRRVAPGPIRRDLAWGGAFLALAVCLVIAVALVSNAILKPDQSPQRDLQELLRGLSGWIPGLVLFVTVAGLAPFFEELLFRGLLLPIMARSQRMAVALGLSALLFGAIHLQPTGLPVLAALGLVMGLAMRQSGSLRTPILVHACWNGSLFLLMRAFA